METINGTSAEEKNLCNAANQLVKDFLFARVPVFVQLTALREKGWRNPLGDQYFEQQRERADKANHEQQRNFFNMMQQIANEMNSATGFLSELNRKEEPQKLLDLCMAPGGFSAAVQRSCPKTELYGISLPESKGGYKLLIKIPKDRVWFTDITMLSSEMGAIEIPSDHPDSANFSHFRPFIAQAFDLVICDGQVLRNHPRKSYREQLEASRLALSQLVFALQRIKAGGTLLMLLHKLESLDTLELLYKVSKFSKIQLFKPKKKHSKRSSFYLVAKEVDPHSQFTLLTLKSWKEAWSSATFEFYRDYEPSAEVVQNILAEFGEEFI
ncbi:Ribosomal RNA methyltransferase RrmJ/FtsJ [Macrophomina phaseolina MS6]|uniref:Ribosomal RNA methyltransferase RrmJ/FtsJ n=1 Tax=Macrophomina phaseolina (strain MS6) TaxID=1126212 RepID=K2SLF6_MACPH|nr:Ribosomal RNA methyltransferase RrmJ/FtsJ [Macrophomina phaseolina MS6]